MLMVKSSSFFQNAVTLKRLLAAEANLGDIIKIAVKLIKKIFLKLNKSQINGKLCIGIYILS